MPHADLPAGCTDLSEQSLILVTCRDEKEQVELLRRFKPEEWPWQALLG